MFFLFLKILTLGKKFSPGLGFEPTPLWAKSESHTTRLWRSVSPGNFIDLHSLVVWLSLFAHTGAGSNPSSGENLLPKVKIFKKNMHKMDKLARYFPKVGNSEYFSRKKLCQNKIGRFHLKHPVYFITLKYTVVPINLFPIII